VVLDTTLEPQETEEVATEEVSGETATEETTETPEPEEITPDPVQILTDRLGQVETNSGQRIDGIEARVKSELGKLEYLQSVASKLDNNDPIAALDPRLSANETLLSALVDTVANSDDGIPTEQNRETLRSAIAQYSDAQKQRDNETFKREVLAEAKATAAPEQTETAPTAADQWQAATQDVQAALPADFDMVTIPQDVWAEGVKTGRPSLAVRHVLNWVDTQSADALDGLAERKAAAGDGAPSASAGGTTIDTLLSKLEELGPTVLSEAELKQVDKHLGMKI
jgi:cation transport regulator ChaB